MGQESENIPELLNLHHFEFRLILLLFTSNETLQNLNWCCMLLRAGEHGKLKHPFPYPINARIGGGKILNCVQSLKYARKLITLLAIENIFLPLLLFRDESKDAGQQRVLLPHRLHDIESI